MYAQRHFNFLRALRWSWRIFPWIGLWATALTSAHYLLGLEVLQLPALPVSILGTAVSFYLGFKGNAAYQRLWEARKIWGGIVNTSRTWGLFVTTYVTERHRPSSEPDVLHALQRELIHRHVAWMGALRTQLRRSKPWEHRATHNDAYRASIDTLDTSDDKIRSRIQDYVPAEEVERVLSKRNPATQLVQRQGARLADLREEGWIEDFRHMEMGNVLQELYTLQGKAERIKNFPLPRQYATANHWFVKAFIVLLPLALLNAFHISGLPEAFIWLTVPASLVMGWIFYFWDMVVDYTENPFEGLINDIPIDSMARGIEIDLREMIDDDGIPPAIAANADGVIM